MKTSFLVLLAAGMFLAGCGKSTSSTPAAPPPGTNAPNTSQPTNKAEVAHPSGGYLGALVQADKSARKTIDVSYLNQAVQLFNTQEGRYPKDLNELVPNYVAQLPAAPYGYRINYDPNSGLVTVVKQ
jgi:uncharacterized lipoprotein YajG